MARSGRAIRLAGAAVAAVVLSSGCARRHASSGNESAAAETTLTGIVSVTGTSFDHALQLRAGNGAVRLLAQPADSAALSRLSGLELSVRGASEARGFRVSSFTALRAGDQAVVDGVLVQSGASIALRTSAGELTLGNPPAALRQMIGARVWIAGPLGTGPNSYGVIVPKP